jgi:predicted Rossmann fold flavoprotein
MKSAYDVVIIGGGAAGLMCASVAGSREKSVCVIEHGTKPAEKIRISGGGRCNFINIHQSPQAYLSDNTHFCKSALTQFTQHDFIKMVENHKIAYHEKTLGQLFCDNSAHDIINMLLQECKNHNVHICLNTTIENINYADADADADADTVYSIKTNNGITQTKSLVIATGGLSIPKMGATPFGYKIAEQFNIKVTPLRAGLVPLTFQNDVLEFCKNLAGVSVDAVITYDAIQFQEGLLFTHRGLSGPSILQISSYWQQGHAIQINLLPNTDIFTFLKHKKSTSKQDITTVLFETDLPKRLSLALLETLDITGKIADMPDKKLQAIANHVHHWHITPSGTEGYRTAEVTVGGIDTSELSSKTMEAKNQKGLYFIGEVVDVTGHLGGFNFGWAWSSGYACGNAI